jgi:ribonuclease VapC
MTGRVLDVLTGEGPAGIGTPLLLEATIAMTGRVGPAAIPMVNRLIQELQMVPIPFGPEHWREASDAYVRYGKGRHSAGLNFGDCMSCAVARLAAQPLCRALSAEVDRLVWRTVMRFRRLKVEVLYADTSSGNPLTKDGPVSARELREGSPTVSGPSPCCASLM